LSPFQNKGANLTGSDFLGLRLFVEIKPRSIETEGFDRPALGPDLQATRGVAEEVVS
jgi:hypothetical protein